MRIPLRYRVVKFPAGRSTEVPNAPGGESSMITEDLSEGRLSIDKMGRFWPSSQEMQFLEVKNEQITTRDTRGQSTKNSTSGLEISSLLSVVVLPTPSETLDFPVGFAGDKVPAGRQ